jgi:hypothetical protein
MVIEKKIIKNTKDDYYYSRTHQRNKMKNKGKDKSNDEEILNKFGQEYKKTESINSFQKLFFFFVAQVTTMLPSYLFQGVKNLEFSGMTIILYIVVCAIATFFLFYAYEYVFLRSKPVYVALIMFVCCFGSYV